MKRTVGLIMVGMLAACTKTEAPTPIAQPKSESPQALMVRVSKTAQACWFKTKNPIFKQYRMAAEVDSYSGKPRFLIVPKNNPAGLPKLVAQAERIGGRTQFTSFGPLLQSKSGPKLSAQLNAWSLGRTSC